LLCFAVSSEAMRRFKEGVPFADESKKVDKERIMPCTGEGDNE
jgi:hypothetical protein